jgi:hypothetical protein
MIEEENPIEDVKVLKKSIAKLEAEKRSLRRR